MDPLGFEAGDTNFYRYEHNRATVALDPEGLQAPLNLPTFIILDYNKRQEGGGNYGAFAWGINWLLKERDNKGGFKSAVATGDGGWILQHVKIGFSIKDQNNNQITKLPFIEDPKQHDYWEAWRVPPGAYRPAGGAQRPFFWGAQVLKANGVPATAVDTTAYDWFAYRGVGKPSSGDIQFIGEAYYIDNIKPNVIPALGFKVGGADLAGGLLSLLEVNNNGKVGALLGDPKYRVTGPSAHNLTAHWTLADKGKTSVIVTK